MDVSIVVNDRQRHERDHRDLIAEGFRAHGIDPQIVDVRKQPKTRIAVCWGWRTGRKLRQKGHEVLVMERGYLGDRFYWTSLALNGLNGRGQFFPRDDPSRFQKHFQLSPWKAPGEYILVIGQVSGDANLFHTDIDRWYCGIMNTCAEIYSRPIYFRPHPKSHGPPPKNIPILGGELKPGLDGAYMIVSFNSNTAVESVVNGTPAFVADIGSMAFKVSSQDLLHRLTPDRETWANRLAWTQWSPQELSDGTALRRFIQNLESRHES